MKRVLTAATLLGLRTDAPTFFTDAEDAIERASKSLRVSSSALLLAAQHRGSAAYKALVSELTVRETYFLRSKHDWDFINTFAERRLHDRQPIRGAWSVGCASGEEAWSLALTLRQFFPQALVAGTDASLSSLDVARAGVYARRSFRDTEPSTVEGLLPMAEGWSVMPSIRGMVTFAELNLAHDPVVPPAPLPAQVDLIICRNVLMYLRQDIADRVIEALAFALAPGGVFILSPHEVPHIAPPGLVPVPGHHAFMRPASTGRIHPQRARPTPVPGRVTEDLYESTVLTRAWKAADAGRTEEALAITANMDGPEVLFLRGTIFWERDQVASAEALFRHVLLVSPQHIGAHVQLYLLYVRQGSAHDARVLRERLLNLLKDRRASDRIDVGDLTVREVRTFLEEEQ